MRIYVLRGVLALFLLGQSAPLVSIPAWAAPEEATSKAVEWFLKHKAPDGALPSYENGYTVGGTADGVFALAAAGEKPVRFGRPEGDTPVDYLEAHAGDDSEENDPRDDAHLAGKVALAAAISGKDPQSFGGANLVRFIQDRYDPATGGYRGAFTNFEVTPMGQALAILGLIAAGETVPGEAIDYLVTSQMPDGGWDSSGYGTDLTTSAMAVQALVAATQAFGPTQTIDAAVAKSIPFFHGEQNEDGGFSNQKEYSGNYCSGARVSEVDATGFAIQVIRAAGQDPGGEEWTSPTGLKPRNFLLSLQHPDGSFSYQEGPDCKSNGGSTYAAVLGIAEASFPCLLELGTCPQAAPSAQGGGPAIDPLFEEARRADNGSEVLSAGARPPVTREGAETARRNAKSSAGRTRVRQPGRQAISPPSAPAGPCPSRACPTGTNSPGSTQTADSPSFSRPISKSSESRLADEDRLSDQEHRGLDPFVWVAIGIIAALSVSIGRQVWRTKQ